MFQRLKRRWLIPLLIASAVAGLAGGGKVIRTQIVINFGDGMTVNG